MTRLRAWWLRTFRCVDGKRHSWTSVWWPHHLFDPVVCEKCGAKG